ncbi:MAG: hypothetical protein HY329_23430 [Chloroflexi bacterium]|nr:hypothetical protein [Chloroflexota bacterium]
MGFDRRDIRPAMDVYTADNVYLGTVLAVVSGPGATPEAAGDEPTPTVSAFDGEQLGPVPTQAVGNAGPATQSAARSYAVASDGAAPIGAGEIRVGRWWGLVGRYTIPLSAVQTVSLERVVLAVKAANLTRG